MTHLAIHGSNEHLAGRPRDAQRLGGFVFTFLPRREAAEAIAITSCALAYWACSTQQTEPARGIAPVVESDAQNVTTVTTGPAVVWPIVPPPEGKALSMACFGV